MTTIARRMYSGTGFPLSNGAGDPITFSITSDSLEQAIYDLCAEIRAVLGGPGSTITQMLGASAEQQAQIAVYSRGAAALGILGAMIAPEVAVPLALGAEVITIANELDLTPDVEAPTNMPVNQQTQLWDGTKAVALPDPAPAGYGGGDAEDVAAAVWAYGLTVTNAGGEVQLAASYAMVELLAGVMQPGYLIGYVDPGNPAFSIIAPYPSALYYGLGAPWGTAHSYSLAPLDRTQIEDDDTALSFCTREYPALTWNARGPYTADQDDGAFAAIAGQSPALYWRFNLTTAQLLALAPVSATVEATLAPVWPGLANVTLGAPVPFDDIMEITGPMDGVLVDYTTPPTKVDNWTVDGYTNYGHAGQIAFTSDNGYVESWQYLQWGQQVYVPRALSEAASVLLRPIAGQEGTVTPWTRN